MAENPWSKFFWSDWESDQGLRLCSLAAQGLWMRMLCVCARNEPKGSLAINGKPLDVTDIARLASVSETEAAILVEELDRNGVFSRTRNGCIYSRRMMRDERASKEGRKHKKRGLGQVAENKEEKPYPSRGPTRGASTHIPEARGQIRKRDADASQKAGDEAFARFWAVYPKKVGKPAALKRWIAALKAGAIPEEIIAGAERYAKWLGSAVAGEFRPQPKYPQGWLSEERWRDDPGAGGGEQANSPANQGGSRWEYIAAHGTSAGWRAA